VTDMCGPLTPHQFTEKHIELLVTGWKKRYARATLYGSQIILRRIVAAIGAASGRPYIHQEVKFGRAPTARKTIATPEEIAALLAASPAWIRLLIFLGAHAGFRISDCMRVAPIHFNRASSTITIEQQKNGRPVTVPATAALQAYFHEEWDGSHQPLYIHFRGKRISKTAFNKKWAALKRKTGVNPNLWFHDLRRTLAVSLYELTKDLRVVEQMLGHESLASTIHYLEHRDPAKLKPYLAALFTPKTAVIQ